MLAAAWYAAKLVLRLKPRLFVAGLLDELLSRTGPFIEALLAARIITLLPSLTDIVEREAALKSILITLGMLLALRIILQLEGNLYRYYESKQQIDLRATIDRLLTEKFASLPYARYEDKSLIDQYDLAKQYAGQLQYFVLNDLRSMAGAVYMVILAAIAIVQFSPWLALLLSVAAVPQVILELRVNREQRRVWRNMTTVRRKSYTYAGLFDPGTIKDSRLFGLVNYALDKLFHYGKLDEEERLRVDRQAEKYRLSLSVLDTVIETAALAYVVRLIYIGAQPIGQFVFAQQVLLRYSGGLSQFMRAVQEMDESLAGAAEFRGFMRLPSKPAGLRDFDANQDIVLQNVNFTYPGARRAALRNVSLTIPTGKTIALVGENGAGKTTLVKLLMKLYEPTQGTVNVGAKGLTDLDEDAWHDRLGVLFQDFLSFADFTIRENVIFGRLSRHTDGPAGDKAVIGALAQAGADKFVRELSQGLDTYLGKFMDEENGTLLSGGQLQRLAIARVLYRDPDILIMDEPTSAVDAEAEYKIFTELEKSRQGKTTILISHRFSTVRKADYIFVLDKGRLVEQGTHAELLALDGKYAIMFNAQAEGYR